MSAFVEAGRQPLEALARANMVRRHGSRVKRDLATGQMTLRDVLDDPDAGSLPLATVLLAQPRWGRARMLRLLATLAHQHATPISEGRRLRDLTSRQRALILMAAGTVDVH